MLANTREYLDVLERVKQDIARTQAKAALRASSELICLYWRIGCEINARLEWGKTFIDSLARDIRQAYPGMKGFSSRSLRYMAKLAREVNEEFLQQVVAKIPWGHAVCLMSKTDPGAKREWYARSAIENGWSRAVLEHQIDTHLYVELKNEAFKPEFSGKLGFYVAAVDGELCGEGDNPTVGLLLCKTKDDVVAEYSLRATNAPIGVSEYRLGDELPAAYANVLPSPEDLVARL